MPAFSEEVEEALSEGIKISFLLSPTSIRPVEGGKLVVECVRVRLEGKDQSGRPRPVPLEGEGVSFLADQVIAATGQLPELSYLPPDFQIDRGLLRVNRWGQTNIEKVFAGGDIIDRPRSVAEAIGSAKRAAIAMDHYLKGEDLRFLSQRGLMSCTIREHLGLIDSEPRRSERLAEFSQLNTAYVAPKPRTRARKLPVSERNGFEEVNLPIEVEEACYEAERCMSCGVCSLCGNCYVFCPDGAVRRDEARGRYVVDYDYCKGCGICHNECPAAAIVMEADEQ